jgi:cytochrome c peroxidase
MNAPSYLAPALVAAAALALPAPSAPAPAFWDAEPVRPLPAFPLGIQGSFLDLPFRVTPETVRLGRWLFFDRRLSRDQTVSCATCHRPEHGFSEPTAHSTGVAGRQGARKAPPILNAAFTLRGAYFWDGRASSMVEQAIGPMANPLEMDLPHPEVVARVAGIPGYRAAFRAAYDDDRLDIGRIAAALAAYEATRLSGDSRFDRFQAGDAAALSADERAGREVFFGRGRCDRCHSGPGLTDSSFHVIGIGGPTAADIGRFAVTGDPRDRGAFRTPTLRDVSRRAPYMHDGSARTLRDAVRAYQDPAPHPHLDPEMSRIELSWADVDALVAFLGALDGRGFEDEAPRLFPE